MANDAPPAGEDTADAARTARLLTGGRLQALGGLVLAVSAFCPAIEACNAPIVPVQDFGLTFRNSSFSADDVVAALFILMPYLIGATIAGSFLWRRLSQQDARSQWGRLVIPLIATWILPIIALMITDWPPPDVTAWMAVLIACYVLFMLLRLWRGMGARMLCVRWCAALCCSIWFWTWFLYTLVDGSASYYGLWLSMAASAAILIGTFKEAQVVGHLNRRQTLWRLLIGRLPIWDPEGPRCARCDYLLIGLPTNRCPECGTLFERPAAPAG